MDKWNPVLNLTTIVFQIELMLENPLDMIKTLDGPGMTWMKVNGEPALPSRKRKLIDISGYDENDYGPAEPYKRIFC